MKLCSRPITAWATWCLRASSARVSPLITVLFSPPVCTGGLHQRDAGEAVERLASFR